MLALKFLISLIIFSTPMIADSAESDIRTLLAKQGFSGVLTTDAHLVPLGSLECKTEQFQIVYYNWQESNAPGLAVHASYRIVILDKTNYIGSYEVDDKPRVVHHNTILFPYSRRAGNTISCAIEGFPKSVLLNGENHGLMK